MCGISGIILKNNLSPSEDIMHKMNNRIIHRGPDAEGFYQFENVALGHRRLSIIDLTESANQPMHKHGFSIVFNGEIYNYIELRNELIQVGYEFQTNSDTEVILSAYHYFGKECTNKFNGMWAFLLLDENATELFISRDQFGIKPLYIHQTNDFISFASEIKQFLELPGFEQNLNFKVAANFLITGALNQQQETFFQDVIELKPGQNIILNTRSFEFKYDTWYSYENFIRNKKSLNYEEAVFEFNRLFEDAVKIRMRSDVKLGSCLSGGIDSSAIVCKVKELEAHLETITSCYADGKFDEQKFSDIVSKRVGFKSNKIFGDSKEINRVDIFTKMVYHQDQPIATGSHFSEYNVFSKAKELGFIVMLDGQGSDEYLGGYPEFKTIIFKRLLFNLKSKSFKKFIKDEANLYQIKVSSILKRELKTLFYFPLTGFIKKIIGKEHLEYNHFIRGAYKKTKQHIRNFQGLSILELEKTSIPYQLHSEDRNSMLFSIESRLPFLDYRLVEFCLSLPDNFKMRNGFSKKILRDAISSLPIEIKERKDKMGFVSPDEALVKENSTFFLEKLILALTKYQFITQTFIEQFNLFLLGKKAYDPKFFRAVSLVVFCEVFEMKVK
jgi:asparagine synthase (glutamine-hydrolysing)